jgi:hypothetical protein
MRRERGPLIRGKRASLAHSMVLPDLEAELSTAELTLNLTPACRIEV